MTTSDPRAARLDAILDCAVLAVGLYEHLQPEDASPFAVLVVVTPCLDGRPMARWPSRQTVAEHLRIARACGAEADTPAAALAVAALVDVAAVALALCAQEPWPRVKALATLACQHTAAAVTLSLEATRSGAERAALRRVLEPHGAGLLAALDLYGIPRPALPLLGGEGPHDGDS